MGSRWEDSAQPITDAQLAEVREVVGYEGRYEVSRGGEVWSTYCQGPRKAGPKKLALWIDQRGYPSVTLHSGGGKQRPVRVHRIVAKAFLGEPPPGSTVNHIDADKTNNHASNLEYVSMEGNRQHAHEAGLFLNGERHPRAKLTDEDVEEIRRRVAGGESKASVARSFGVHDGHVGQIVRYEVRAVPTRRIRAALPEEES